MKHEKLVTLKPHENLKKTWGIFSVDGGVPLEQ